MQQDLRPTGRPRVIGVARVLSLVYLIWAVVGTTNSIFRVLFSDLAQQIALPVRPFWPQIPDGVEVVDGPIATVVGGGFTHADVLISGLGPDVRYWLAAGYLAQGLTAALIAFAIFRMLAGIGGEPGFQQAVSRAAKLAGVTIMVGGIAWQGAFAAAGSIASHQTLDYRAWNTPTGSADTVNGPASYGPIGISSDPGGTVNFWPIGIGILLLAISAGFRYVERIEATAAHALTSGGISNPGIGQ